MAPSAPSAWRVAGALLLLTGMLASASASSGNQCVWYGKCGQDPAWGQDGRHILNCLYRGPPKPATPLQLQQVAEACPHLSRDADAAGLCCDSAQLDDLIQNFQLPSAVLARCPTCMDNFRKTFCDLTCHPNQAAFVNASKVLTAKDDKGNDDDSCVRILFLGTDVITLTQIMNDLSCASINLVLDLLSKHVLFSQVCLARWSRS